VSRQTKIRECTIFPDIYDAYRLRSFTNEKLWYKDVGTSGKGLKKKLLPEKYRRLFANKQIVCIEYQDITDDDEREIFQVPWLFIFLYLFSALTLGKKCCHKGCPTCPAFSSLTSN